MSEILRTKKQLHELRRFTPEEYAGVEKLPFALVLDDIRSANNVGSLFRTADCFALQHVYLCGITATPPHRDILKTALGATDTVSWSYHQSCAQLIEELVGGGAQVQCLEQTEQSTPLDTFLVGDALPLVLVVGNEVKGVSQQVIDLSHGTIEIRQYGTKHSLNVAVSAGMAVWEISRQLRSAAPLPHHPPGTSSETPPGPSPQSPP
ncbi:tRNA G18 (ribose-2'-O)-methylase SpoU [Lewinella aquimaris]|uniref:tRNA G18 (Ribose-2'-O)-methylase SpoU n=1 Tax=Neolewinella aquimaris TaxID=1835722 RepID=A0A840EJH6_9BACT|nr:TrmH family RNA methyltransferase [Neolewinella aquimaris]MBB4081026.1 tRNA G18 (ribose-2'-O)-methylase SpoU [Neolewinella aquimaris]